ncbi:cytochrome P450 [Acephala macrosclerotiorum]|nr:cytochrome P450 [Acephala macrosclerotiorum]
MYSVLLATGILLLFFYIFLYHFSQKQDHREPPLVNSRILSLGHIVKIVKHGILYFDKLSSSSIFTISILNYKIYIITDLNLVSAVHRHRDLPFDPIIADIVSSMVGDSPNVLRLAYGNEPGKPNHYLRDTTTIMHEKLVPGLALWNMNARVLDKVSSLTNEISENFEERKVWYWLQDAFTKATCETLFGIHHPLQNSSLVQAVWDFDAYQIPIMLMPRWIANLFPPTRRALVSQRQVHAAFRQYYADPNKFNHPSVSALVRSRMKVNLSYGIPMEEIANSELGLLFVATTNAIPTLYWSVVYIFSHPKLVSDLRTHLEQSGVVTSIGDAQVRRTLRVDHTKFHERCPLLVAAYHETMRLTNLQPGTRIVREDMVLGGDGNEKHDREGYLLKKGSLVMTPARMLHLSHEIWGDNAELFRPERWMQVTKKQKRAFIPFGGGKHLCPGRDFAFAEIVGALAVFLLGFEIVGLDGNAVRIPAGMETKFGVAGPSEEGKALKIKIRRRPGWENVIWEFGAKV